MKDKTALQKLAESILGAWNTQNVEKVLACYTKDLLYRDPNTTSDIRGSDAMRQYLTKLFSNWQIKWSLREIFPIRDQDGAVILWHAIFRKAGSDKVVETDGIDIAILRGELLARNEVYFDRVVLSALQ